MKLEFSDCINCPAYVSTTSLTGCRITNRTITNSYRRQAWCPLKEQTKIDTDDEPMYDGNYE